MQKNKKQAAFFDVDKTIVRGNTGQMYVMHFFLKGLINPIRAFLINFYVGCYMLNCIDYDKAMKKSYLIVKGWNVNAVKRLIKKHFQKKVKGCIYNSMRNVIEQHRKEKRLIVFVTNSWDIMTEDVALELKADALIATRVGIKNNVFTGEVVSPNFGEYKRKNIKKFAKQHGIDLKNSYAYSDHISDVPMLDSVGNPTAVNPDKNLLKYAAEKKWNILYPK